MNENNNTLNNNEAVPLALNNANSEKTYNNLRFNKGLRKEDYFFLVFYFLLVVIFGSIIFGIGVAFKQYWWEGYVAFLAFYAITSPFLMVIKINAERLWWYIYDSIKFKLFEPKKIDNINFELDFSIKKIARTKNSEDDTCNVWFLTNSLHKECILLYKLDIIGLSDASNINEIYDLVRNLNNDYYIGLNKMSKKTPISIDESFFQNDSFDTSAQIKMAEKKLRIKTNPTQIALISKEKIMYENLKEWFSYENEPEIFEQNKKPFNLVNNNILIAIKGSSYNQALTLSEELQSRLSSITNNLKPITWNDTKNIFHQFFGKDVINFETIANEGNVQLSSTSDFNDYEIYNICADNEKDDALSHSALENIKLIKQHKTYLEVVVKQDNSEKTFYKRVIGFKDFPNSFNLGWQKALIESGASIYITQKLQSFKEKKLNRKLLQKHKENNKNWIKSESLNLNNPYLSQELFNNKEASLRYANEINNQNIGLINYRYYALISATNLEDLDALTHSFDNVLSIDLDIDKDKRTHYVYHQYKAWLSCFTSCNDWFRLRKRDSNFISSLALAQSLPYEKNTTFLKEGVLIGSNPTRSRLVILNPIDPVLNSSFNYGIFGMTGKGKSNYVKELILGYSMFLRPVKVVCLDPNGDYLSVIYRLNGIALYSDPKKTIDRPVSEKQLYELKPTLMNDYLTKLLDLKYHNQYLISRFVDIELGNGYFINILNKDITPDDLENYFHEHASLLKFTLYEQSKLRELYKFIYNACITRWLINLFRIVDTVGEVVDFRNRTVHLPSSFVVYDAYKKIVLGAFNCLITNMSNEQSSLIEECITKTYDRFCKFHLVQDSVGNTFLSKTNSKRDEITLDELLNRDAYPVMNDFYKVLSEEIELKINDDSVPQDRKSSYWDLKIALLPFVSYRDENGKIYKGIYSDYWNTDNKKANLNADYITIIIDDIADGFREHVEYNKNRLSINKNTIALTQLYVIINLIKAEGVKNSIARLKTKLEEQPFLWVVWDELHNTIKEYKVEDIVNTWLKEVRKLNMGLGLSTQNTTDILDKKNGKGMWEQLSNKSLFGMSGEGFKVIDGTLSMLGGFHKSNINFLLNPDNDPTGILQNDKMIAPRGHQILMPNSNDLLQIPVQNFYCSLDMQLAGNNNWQGGRSIGEIFNSAKDGIGYYPKSSRSNANSKEKIPLPPLQRKALLLASMTYERNNQRINQSQVNEINELIANANSLQNSNLKLDFNALLDFSNQTSE